MPWPTRSPSTSTVVRGPSGRSRSSSVSTRSRAARRPGSLCRPAPRRDHLDLGHDPTTTGTLRPTSARASGTVRAREEPWLRCHR
jgi:hypothetical protein